MNIQVAAQKILRLDIIVHNAKSVRERIASEFDPKALEEEMYQATLKGWSDE